MQQRKMFLPFIISLIVLFFFSFALLPLDAQQQAESATTTSQPFLLTNNSGNTSTTWFISGEPSLVINGFDLTPRNLGPPIVVDAVNIAVETAVPGAPVEAVVYQDPNGGSPVDAQIVGRGTTTIDSPGLISVQFPTPVLVNAPVLWVGFYFPVDFRFLADESGTSVLTYWAWTPNGTFDINNLQTAAVLGPADGTEPVNLDMNGIARITANIRQPDQAEVEQLTAFQQTLQTQTATASVISATSLIATDSQFQTAVTTGNSNALQSYGGLCSDVSFDRDDINISGRGAFSLSCELVSAPISPPTIRNSNLFARGNNSWQRKEDIYEIKGTGGFLSSPSAVNELRIPVTHCIHPLPEDLSQAVIGVAHGIPRAWEILPSARFNDLVCAEVTHTGLLAYFIPFTGNDGFSNTNLAFSFNPILDPAPPTCGRASAMTVAIKNDGFEAAGPSRLLVESTLAQDPSQVTRSQFYDIPALDPGEEFRFTTHDYYIFLSQGAAHNTDFIIDFEDRVFENNENDNKFRTTFILQPVRFCATPTPRFPGDPNVRP